MTDLPDTFICYLAQRDAAPVDRAAVLQEAADEAESVAESLRAHHEFERSTGALDVMTELRRMADEAQYVAAPCSPGGCEPGGEPCTTHERLMAHAEGDHELCAAGCGADEVQQPACGHCGHPAAWHDPWEGCVGPDGIGSAGSGDCTCTRSPDAARQDPADVSVASGGTCNASIHGVVGPIGPCILRHPHDGPVHKAADGTTWNLQQPGETPAEAELERLRAEVARLREGEEPITDERVIPTPAQWIWRWNQATVAERLDRVAAIQKADAALDRIHRLAADMLTWSRRTP